MKQHGAQYTAYGGCGALNAMLFYLFWQAYLPSLYDSLTLRLICVGLCLPLILHRRWPRLLQPYLPLYWYTTLLLTIPAFFTYMLVMNHFESLWAVTTIGVVFTLHFLVDFESAILLLSVGSCLGVLAAAWQWHHLAIAIPFFPPPVHYAGFLLTYIVCNGIVAVFSHNKQAFERSERQRLTAEQISKEKSEFIANMSHDLRTALMGIQSVAELNQSVLTRAHPMHKDWQMVHEASTTLHHFVESILLTAKFGMIPALTPERFDLPSTLQSIVSLLKPAFKQKRLTYHLIGQHFNPPPQLVGHPLLIQRLVLNLLNNAIHFTHPDGEVNVIYEVIRDSEDSPSYQLLLSVSDSGEGMSPAKQSMLFQAFHCDAPSYQQSCYQGSGLGLHMVQKLLCLLEGEIEVTSVEGEGSTFTCSLPIKLAPSQEEGALRLFKQTPTHKERLTLHHKAAMGSSIELLPRILLVEDNDMARYALKARLEALPRPFHIDEAESVAAAKSFAVNHRYRLILMDIGLPDGDGIEAAKSIRRMPFHQTTPIVAVTAHLDAAGKKQCLQDGLMQGVEMKPVSHTTLMAWVATYLTSSDTVQGAGRV